MNYYMEIKKKLIDNEVYKQVKDYSKNKNDLSTYYEVGRLLIGAQGGEKRAKYGDNLIKEHSIKLTKELGKKYDTTTLKRMRKFYLIIEKGATMWPQLPWSNYVEPIEQVRDYSKNKNDLSTYYEVGRLVKDYSKNKNDLSTYYEVGRLLIEAQGGKDKAKYGNQLIKDYSKRLTREIGYGYGERNLYNMRAYYLLIRENEILQSLPAELTWSHVCDMIP